MTCDCEVFGDELRVGRVRAACLALAFALGACAAGAVPASSMVRITHVAPSLESAIYATVAFNVTNTSDAPLTILSYRVVWPEGTATFTPSDFVVAPHSSRARTVRVRPGNTDSLLDNPGAARILILETKPAS